MKDFTQASGYGPHLRPFDPGGQFHRIQPFPHQLPCEVDIRAVVKRDDNLREAKLRERADDLQAWQTADRLLHWEGDLAFSLFWRQRGSNRIDLNLNRRRIRKGVDVEAPERNQPQAREAQGDQDHQRPVPERKIDDPVEHGVSFPTCRRCSLHQGCS